MEVVQTPTPAQQTISKDVLETATTGMTHVATKKPILVLAETPTPAQQTISKDVMETATTGMTHVEIREAILVLAEITTLMEV